MAQEKSWRTRGSRYESTLDELLGIRSGKEKEAGEAALTNQAEPAERPTTRHGRNREAVSAVMALEPSFPKPHVINVELVAVSSLLRPLLHRLAGLPVFLACTEIFDYFLHYSLREKMERSGNIASLEEVGQKNLNN
ncbi:unnamed protein product [Gongylonema pulchrum]|uniref:Uncharacterized protein n=1 Tax=Gongylonema pulchrum TaxID=637853 RepID=A0A183D2E1_9BILA|nr:unnamed protein product [Gongylonema pulchrum]